MRDVSGVLIQTINTIFDLDPRRPGGSDANAESYYM